MGHFEAGERESKGQRGKERHGRDVREKTRNPPAQNKFLLRGVVILWWVSSTWAERRSRWQRRSRVQTTTWTTDRSRRELADRKQSPSRTKCAPSLTCISVTHRSTPPPNTAHASNSPQWKLHLDTVEPSLQVSSSFSRHIFSQMIDLGRIICANWSPLLRRTQTAAAAVWFTVARNVEFYFMMFCDFFRCFGSI